MTVKCPKCSRDDRIEVVCKMWVRIVHDGTNDAVDGSQEWDENSPAHCTACDWCGEFGEASVPEEWPTELTPEGEQYVIPGAEQKAPAGKQHQGNLWDGKR